MHTHPISVLALEWAKEYRADTDNDTHVVTILASGLDVVLQAVAYSASMAQSLALDLIEYRVSEPNIQYDAIIEPVKSIADNRYTN